MPIYLDEVPGKREKISRPVSLRWAALLVFFLITGIVLTFWQWSGERSGFSFWFTAVGLPLCVWGLLYNIRRIGYWAEQNGQVGWDYECESITAAESARGKRFAWILDSYIQTQAGPGVGCLLTSMENDVPLTQAVKPRSGEILVRHSRLDDFDSNANALVDAIDKIAKRVGKIISPLPPQIKCWLMFEYDTQSAPEKYDELIHLISHQLGRQVHRLPVQGINAVDYWLDHHWTKPSVFIALSVSLRSSPQQNDAEAISSLVLCNRRSHQYPDVVKLHRPQKSGNETLPRNLAHALRWAAKKAEDVTGIWITGEALTLLPGWNRACEENRMALSLTDDVKIIDNVLGFAGKASPWIAVALAGRVVQSKGAQLIAAHPEKVRDEIWIATITAEERQKDLTNK